MKRLPGGEALAVVIRSCILLRVRKDLPEDMTVVLRSE